MNDFNDMMEEKLNELMKIYGCNNQLEALVMYCKDYEWDEWFKFYEAGGTIEEFNNHMETEYRKTETSRMKDPKKSMAFNKVNILLKEYFKDG